MFFISTSASVFEIVASRVACFVVMINYSRSVQKRNELCRSGVLEMNSLDSIHVVEAFLPDFFSGKKVRTFLKHIFLGRNYKNGGKERKPTINLSF